MRDSLIFLVAVALMTVTARGAPAKVVVVNRDTGGVLWLNSTGQVLDVAAYTLQSPSGGFQPSEWLSISGHYDADSGGGLDPNDVWTVLGGSPTDLSESTIGMASLGAGTLVDLGTPWTPGHQEDVSFEYLDAGLDQVVAGGVMFVSEVPGDYNGNGLVEQGDLDLVLSSWGLSVSVPPGWFHDFPLGVVDQAELDRVLTNWGILGRTSPRPADLPLATAAVPEAAAVELVLAAVIAGCAVAGGKSYRGALRRARLARRSKN